jgi:hypothetical protein
MTEQLDVGEMTIDVTFKDIKNVHLSVNPPNGNVRIAAPSKMSLDMVRVFTISKLAWIRKQQKKLRDQPRETARKYIDRESHYLWGERCLMKVVEKETSPSVVKDHDRLILTLRHNTSQEKRQAIVEAWYRDQIRQKLPPLIRKWEDAMGVKVERVFIQRMKTKWGSCNHQRGTIRLNSELAKKPPQCLEYVLVHELVHLLEPSHNARFKALMDRFMPEWRHHRDTLNSLPIGHSD